MLVFTFLAKINLIKAFKVSKIGNYNRSLFDTLNVSQKFSSGKISKNDYEELEVKDKNNWKLWLHENHQSKKGVWLKIFKKASKSQSVKYDDALEEALCYGWIDGQRKSNDTESFFQRFTPRRPKSEWSQRNKQIVRKLQQQGRLMPFGLSQIEKAKKDGRWDKSQ